jgi:hypothetical protein
LKYNRDLLAASIVKNRRKHGRFLSDADFLQEQQLNEKNAQMLGELCDKL